MERLSLRLAWAVVVILVAGCGDDDSGGKPADSGQTDAQTDGNTTTPECDESADCENGLFCDGTEVCTNGQCVAGLAMDCSDGIECTEDFCSELTRACRSVAPDLDRDGHLATSCLDDVGAPFGDDCDDTDPLRFPGNPEICDQASHDEDCDPTTHGDRDRDQDGFEDALCCNATSDEPSAAPSCGTDCNDLVANVNSTATEACDFFDNDCDGNVDEAVSVTVYLDADRDGHGAVGANAIQLCADAVGYSTSNDDCNDSPVAGDKGAAQHPGQVELCDQLDNDCDEAVDEEENFVAWYVDADGDNFGRQADSQVPAEQPIISCIPVANRVLGNSDCDDANPAINPAAAELCDGKDNDCNSLADFRIGPSNFEDDDNDGEPDEDCGAGATDCDDLNAATQFGTEEICDSYDNDCDDKVDENTTATVWWPDRDGDGFGDNQGPASVYCAFIPGRTPIAGDCDDTPAANGETVAPGAAIHPGITETCDAVDQDCDFRVDERAPPASSCTPAHAVAACFIGTCVIEQCDLGFDDCDGRRSNGCETDLALRQCGDPAGTGGTSGGVGGTGVGGTGGVGVGGTGGVGGASGTGGAGVGGTGGISGTGGTGVLVDAGFDAGPETLCEASYTISNQASITALMTAGCTHITGNLTINGTALTSLAGLEAIRIVDGNIVITNNSALTSLAGLNGLIVTGGKIDLWSNAQLRDVALTSLRSIGGTLYFYGNPLLTDFEGLEALERIDGDALIIESMSGLTSTAALSGLTFIDGYLSITGTNTILSLVFPALQTIDGNVTIQSNSGLRNLDGFTALRTVTGNILVNSNAALVNLNGLNGITSVGGSFTIQSNGELTNLDTVRVGSIGGALVIRDNAKLASINGFSTLASVSSHVQIFNNAILGSIGGFAALTLVSGHLDIYNNPLLTGISGFGVLQTINAFFSVRDSALLATITGFSALQDVNGGFSITRNPALTQFNSVDSLRSVGDDLVVDGNRVLASIAGLRSGTFTALGNRFVVRMNPLLPACEVSTLQASLVSRGWSGQSLACCNLGCTTCTGAACTSGSGGTAGQSGLLEGNFTVTTTADLATLANVTHITGNLFINNTTLTNLSSLSNLQTIDGNLEIKNNAALTSLNGFNSLTTIGGYFDMWSNGALSTVSALSSLANVGNHLYLYGNNALTSLTGFGAMTSVGDHLTIESMAGLTSLSGLTALTTVGRALSITGCSQLGNVNALANLDTVGGNLTIQSNSNLTSLNGLAGVQSVNGNVTISNNAMLNTISTLALGQVTGNFAFTSNSAITSINSLTATGVGGFLQIQDNTALGSVGGFNTLTSVGTNVLIQNNDAVTTIGGFTELLTVGGYLSITGNAVLGTVAGFGKVTSIQNYMNIDDNTALSSVAGFTLLSTIGSRLSVERNPALTNFNGLDSLTSIGDDLRVDSNLQLNSLAGLLSGTLTFLGNTLTIRSNPALSRCAVTRLRTLLMTAGWTGADQSCCNLGCVTCTNATCTTGPGGTAGQNTVYDASYTIRTPADASAIGTVTRITGGLTIDGSTCSSLTPLVNLQRVDGRLSIKNNTSLTNINGLSGLQQVGGNFEIWSNSALTNVNGLSALQSVGGDLYFYGNNMLGSLGGTTALVSVGGNLNIESHSAITNVSGFTAVATVVGSLNISGNTLLTNLNGFSALATVGGNITIASNGQLANIDGIRDTGPGLLTALGGNLSVTNNANLTTCAVTSLRDSLVADGWMVPPRVFTNTGNRACTLPFVCAGTNNAVCQ